MSEVDKSEFEIGDLIWWRDGGRDDPLPATVTGIIGDHVFKETYVTGGTAYSNRCRAIEIRVEVPKDPQTPQQRRLASSFKYDFTTPEMWCTKREKQVDEDDKPKVLMRRESKLRA